MSIVMALILAFLMLYAIAFGWFLYRLGWKAGARRLTQDKEEADDAAGMFWVRATVAEEDARRVREARDERLKADLREAEKRFSRDLGGLLDIGRAFIRGADAERDKAIMRGVEFYRQVEAREAGWLYAFRCRQERLDEANRQLAAVVEYAGHTQACQAPSPGWPRIGRPACNCGLDALLADIPAAAQEIGAKLKEYQEFQEFFTDNMDGLLSLAQRLDAVEIVACIDGFYTTPDGEKRIHDAALREEGK